MKKYLKNKQYCPEMYSSLVLSVGYLFWIFNAFIFTPVACIVANLEVIKLGA